MWLWLVLAIPDFAISLNCAFFSVRKWQKLPIRKYHVDIAFSEVGEKFVTFLFFGNSLVHKWPIAFSSYHPEIIAFFFVWLCACVYA